MIRRARVAFSCGWGLVLANSVAHAQLPPTPGAPAPDATPAPAPEAPPTAAAPTPAAPPAPAAEAPPAAAAAPAAGADSGTAKDEKNTPSASAYVIPDAPAFTILNVTPATIDRPATISDVGASLANVVTDKGTVRSGVALEVSFRGLHLIDQSSYAQYRNSFWHRVFARTALSLATVSDSATSLLPAQTRLGFGLRVVLIDESDPLLAATYLADVEQAIKGCADKQDFGERAQCTANLYNEQGKLADAKAKAAAVKWNYGGLSLGAAQSLAFTEARVKDGEADQFGAWLAGSKGLGECFQQALGAKYIRNFRDDAHNLTISERSRVGGESFRGSLEVAYTFNKPKDQDVPLAQATLGAEVKLSSGIWLTANVGGAINDASDVAGLFALSNVKWTLEPTPSWKLK